MLFQRGFKVSYVNPYIFFVPMCEVSWIGGI